ncbi:MAG: DNA double-strand break repair nuclease NurA [Candidatus Nezhaarchaeota archaeon]|nr:DNA double-strand break repair nuclease NurA [Candidatus Nezhaarchaeota archaeon]MCX8142358.1 DNA double-strand break repair nuclease NurA [Candidatus Nezhaarchaeota archaeon]MDW8050669.1 DNA double-strand break repair nuclease NurA [Nitrososphaerota archaeon]
MSIWEEDLQEVKKAVEALQRSSNHFERAMKYWVKVEEWADINGCEFIGVDGSFTIKSFKYSTLYLTRAIALSSAVNVKKSKSELLNTVYGEHVRQHAQAIMASLEADVALTAFEKVERGGSRPIVLFDGSLSYMILSHSPRSPLIREATIKTLSSLIERGSAIFIAKSSHSELYEAGLPDMSLFSRMPMGYSKPQEIRMAKLCNMPETYLRQMGLAFKLMDVTVFYAKLVEGGSLLKFEVPGARSEEEVYRLLSMIKAISPKGYPIPLLVAHDNVKLSSMTLRRILSVTGVKVLSGREVLKEVI